MVDPIHEIIDLVQGEGMSERSPMVLGQVSRSLHYSYFSSILYTLELG